MDGNKVRTNERGLTMKPSDYEFAIGDKVVTIYGEVGHVVDICKCETCAERGFCEPIWKVDGSIVEKWITIYDAESGFDDFYQIGKYRFDHEFNKELVHRMVVKKELEVKKLKRRLQVMEELEREAEE